MAEQKKTVAETVAEFQDALTRVIPPGSTGRLTGSFIVRGADGKKEILSFLGEISG